jgi:hypothetical protein
MDLRAHPSHPRRPRRRTRAVAAYLAAVIGSGCALVAAGGCELIAVADRDRIQGAGATGGETGSGGTGGTSCVPEECPGNDTDCRKRACSAAGECITADEPEGTSCSATTDPDAKVCDGVGNCVQCTGEGDCSGDELCVDQLCVPATCVNQELDGDESDVDCGGSCSPCDDGLMCNDLADCASGFCDGGTCAPCTPGGTDCDASAYCDGGVCVDKLPDGDVCTAGEQCQSGACPPQDGVCCDTACTGTCEACLTAKNGGAGNGVCAAVPANDDPDSECPEDDSLCQAAGCNGSAGSPACNIAADTVVCRPGSGDVCDPEETCSGGVCPTDQFEPGTTVCRTGSGDTCDPDETCPGVAGMGCPADIVKSATDVCRVKTGDCDVEELCPGTPQGTCPTDGVRAQGDLGDMDCGLYVCDGVGKDCPDFCDGDEDCDPAVATCNTGPNTCKAIN